MCCGVGDKDVNNDDVDDNGDDENETILLYFIETRLPHKILFLRIILRQRQRHPQGRYQPDDSDSDEKLRKWLALA